MKPFKIIKKQIKANVILCSSTYCRELKEAKVYLHFKDNKLRHIDVEHIELEQFLGRKGGGYYKILLETDTLIVDLSKLLKGLQIILKIPDMEKADRNFVTTCYVRGKKKGLFIGFNDKRLCKILKDIVRK